MHEDERLEVEVLFREVEKICRKLDDLDPERDGPTMYEQIRIARPDGDGMLADVPVVGEFLAKAVGEQTVAMVKESAQIARQMMSHVRNDDVSLNVQVGLLGVLVYLVVEEDLIPDHLPAGYGYIDDAILLRAGLIEFLDELPPNPRTQEEEGDWVRAFASTLPKDVLPQLERIVIDLQNAVGSLRALPTQVLRGIRDQLIQNPQLGALPAAAPGARRAKGLRSMTAAPHNFAKLGGRTANKGHWSGGMYFEGKDVVVLGGPALIGGKVVPPP